MSPRGQVSEMPVIRAAPSGPVVERWHEARFGLTVWTASRWTAAQAEAVALWVQQKVRTQADMAPRSPSASRPSTSDSPLPDGSRSPSR
jgi:hypothetical protein